jgi:predicted outer membrane repeat protein
MKPRFLLGLFVFLTTASYAQTKHFVKQTATGTGTGLGSWANAAGAAQLQGIMAAAASGDTIWVAMGVYHPTAYPTGFTGGASTRDYAFTLNSGVAMYGGFGGSETYLSQRNVSLYVTSLSGDIGTAGVLTDNCYHVITTYNVTNTAILDGFKIDSGYANGGSSISDGGQTFSQSTGAGICDMKSQPTIANCTFYVNQATGEGGAIYFSNCNALPITNCTFTNNTAGGNGGAISKETSSPITFTNCAFTGNQTTVAAGTTGGGAIYSNSGSNDVITNTTFTNNKSANAYGGAIFFNGTSTLNMSHCTLTQNNAGTYGGGLADIGGTSFNVNNCNFNNNAALYGGGIYSNGGSSNYGYDTLANNTATSTTGAGGGGFYVDGTNPIISHCWFDANVTNGGNGAGQYDNGSASPTDSNTVFQANIAKGTASNGGGYYHTGGTGFFVNDVFVDNSCVNYGGAYYNNSSQPVENCTFYNNTAGSAYHGGGYYDVGGSGIKFYNNILWNNSPDNFYSAGSTGSMKLKYNDFPEAAAYPAGGSIVGNIHQTPPFYNTGSYVGADGKWATLDDGLHLITAADTGGVDAVPPSGTNGSYGWPADDIAETYRADPGADSADMGAYEDGIIPLPLSLVQFTAAPNAESGAVDLLWSVTAGGSVTNFQVTRSTDGQRFQAISNLLADPNQESYQYADNTAPEGVLYYRLVITYAGGTTGYSAVLEVNRSSVASAVQIRPNFVAQRSTTLYIGGVKQAGQVMVLAVDVQGRTWIHHPLLLTLGDNYTLLDLGNMPRGVFYLVITGANGWRRVLPFEKE